MSEISIGFVGTGQMGRALARGVLRAGLVSPQCVLAHDPVAAAAQQFEAELPGVQIVESNWVVVTKANAVVLAVKPQSLPTVLTELADVPTQETLFISIIAGATLQTLSEGLRTDRIIRVMPNTPCLIGCGASAFAAGCGATDDDIALVERLLQSIGIAFRLDEKLLDAVTGLSGSGPAYVYTMIEALSDGGVRMGLPRAAATALAAQTVWGAAQMVLSSSEHPSVLKDRVTSPGGTTIAGLQVLERQGLRAALIDAVEAATRRSKELGQFS